MRTLAGRLYESATRFLHAALRAEDVHGHLPLLHAATAIEHLAKARLAEINPLLLADAKQSPSVLLWLADETKHALPMPRGLRTIGLDRAIEIVGRRAALDPYRKTLDELREHRNGVAHFGEADAGAADRLLPEVLAVVRALTDGLVADPDSIFGEYRDLAAAQLAAYDEQEAREYAVRVEQAKVRFQARHPTMTGEIRGALSRELRHRGLARRETFDEQVAPCPVCGLPAHLDGELLVSIDVDADWNPDGTMYHAFPVVEYRPFSLRCSTCGLILDSPGLIDRSGALENWHVDPSDWDQAVAEHQLQTEADADREWDEYYRS
jgi:hypothetical protein